jgi:hypothetical protein
LLSGILAREVYAVPITDYNSLMDTHFISAAEPPRTMPVNVDLGRSALNGYKANDSADIPYGVRPMEHTSAPQGEDPGNLSSHEIYSTEGSRISSFQQASEQDTPPSSRSEFTKNPLNSLNYSIITVDESTSGSTQGHIIHVDLDNTTVRGYGDIDVTQSPLYSQDTQSCIRQDPPPPLPPPLPIPEPDTLQLLGLGLLAFVVLRRKAGQRS